MQILDLQPRISTVFHFCLTVGQNNFVNKIPFLDILDHSERPKPLFWLRSNIKTKTQNGQYFQADIVISRNHISKGEIMLLIV